MKLTLDPRGPEVERGPVTENHARQAAPQGGARTVFCLNCGRVLATVVERDGHSSLQSTERQQTALRRTPKGFRCAHCGGFPYVDD
jgi:hypothetical protein